ncbi:Guanine nucleotide-binding protein-like 1 [Entamoeba marina]
MENVKRKKGKEIKGDKQEKHQLNKDEFIKETKSKLNEQIYANKRDLRPKLLGMETKEVIDKRKELANLPIDLSKRINGRTIQIFDNKGEELDIITRPPWNYDMTSEELNRNEKKVFTKWITNIIDTYQGSINYFESNLETWRQLWRVVERSDVVLMIIDVRFGTLQYNNKLANWIKSCGKGFGVILNKTDLVDKIVVEKWQNILLIIIIAIEGRAEDFTIDSKRNEKGIIGGDENEQQLLMKDSIESKENKKLTVGLVGSPNVGKSSLLNCQLREPYSIVRFFLERLPLEKVYGIDLSENMSVIEFVESLALKKGYITGKAGRADVHKAAREILSDCVNGRIVFMFEPKQEKEFQQQQEKESEQEKEKENEKEKEEQE